MAEQNTDEKDKQAQEAPVDMTVKETGAGVIVETQKQDMSISESEAGQNPTAEQPEKSVEETQDLEQDFQKQQATEQEVKSELAKNGIDFDALAAEHDANGALSAKSLEALEKAGYPTATCRRSNRWPAGKMPIHSLCNISLRSLRVSLTDSTPPFRRATLPRFSLPLMASAPR